MTENTKEAKTLIVHRTLRRCCRISSHMVRQWSNPRRSHKDRTMMIDQKCAEIIRFLGVLDSMTPQRTGKCMSVVTPFIFLQTRYNQSIQCKWPYLNICPPTLYAHHYDYYCCTSSIARWPCMSPSPASCRIMIVVKDDESYVSNETNWFVVHACMDDFSNCHDLRSKYFILKVTKTAQEVCASVRGWKTLQTVNAMRRGSRYGQAQRAHTHTHTHTYKFLCFILLLRLCPHRRMASLAAGGNDKNHNVKEVLIRGEIDDWKDLYKLFRRQILNV